MPLSINACYLSCSSFFNLFSSFFCVLYLIWTSSVASLFVCLHVSYHFCVDGPFASVSVMSPSCLTLSLSLDLKPLMKNKQDGNPPLSSPGLHFPLVSLPHSVFFSTSPRLPVSLLHPSHLSSGSVVFSFFSQSTTIWGRGHKKIQNKIGSLQHLILQNGYRCDGRIFWGSAGDV